MGRRVAMSLLAALCAVVPPSALPAQLMPPPAPGEVEKAMAIVVPPKASHLADYVGLFAGRVAVFDNDKKVASTRAEFLTYLRARENLDVKVLHLSVGNPILVAETVADFPEPRPGVVNECCFYARLATYHLGPGGKVDRVFFIGNGAVWSAD